MRTRLRNTPALARKTDVFGEPPVAEYYDATGTALTVAEPATGQLYHTLVAADFQPVNGAPDFSGTIVKNYGATLIIGGKNNSAAAKTLYYRVLKNGTSLTTGNVSVTKNYYYTLNISTLGGVAVGDVLEVRLWGSTTDPDYRYSAIPVVVAGFAPAARRDRLLLGVRLDRATYSVWTPTLGPNPGKAVGATTLCLQCYQNRMNYISLDALPAAVFLLPVCCLPMTAGYEFLFRIVTATTPSVSKNNSATVFPYYIEVQTIGASVSYIPTEIYMGS